MNELLLYLLEASLYLAVFAIAYRLLLAHLTHFQWMRIYLIASVLFSMSVPLLSASTAWLTWLLSEEPGWRSTSFSLFTSQEWLAPSTTTLSAPTNGTENWSLFLAWLLTGVYGIGLVYKTYALGRNLWKIRNIIARHPKRREGNHWIVCLPQDRPTFSFLHYVFLSTYENLTDDELYQVKTHELVHVQQGHTFDRLFFESAGIILWFNPLMQYLKKELQEVQEYLADQAVGGPTEKRKGYALLLLKLATEARPLVLATGFSDKQIRRRILMLSKPRSLPHKKLIFAGMIPVVASLFLLSACLEEPSHNGGAFRQEAADNNVAKKGGFKIGQIRWQGNTVYDDEALNNELGLKPGDPYDSVTLNQHLSFSWEDPDKPDISSLYMDQGYLYFNINVKTRQVGDGVVDITMDIFEGTPMKVGNIIIQGNQEVPEKEILEQISMKSGEAFNRSKLIESQRAIATMGYFDPQQVGINPIPDPERGTVDIEFVLKTQSIP